MMRHRLGTWCAGLGLAGCATLAAIPPEVGRAPTAVELELIQRFAPRVIAAAREEGFACPTVRFVMYEQMPHDAMRGTARMSPDPCDVYVQVNPRYLEVDPPARLAGSLAHELGHVINGDWTPARAAVPQIERERQADALAIRILKRLGTAECLEQVRHFRRIRQDNIRAWGVEQRETVETHPSFSERIRTFERECRR